ncbi:MAG: hypothetical protein IJR28_02990 [Ottowia sp.]|nr:hypothetical protein [Ottowia sp.]
MNEYLFWTMEGWTESPREGYEVENCQLLGRQQADSLDAARQRLLRENGSILGAGFDAEEIRADQTITQQQKGDIQRVVKYLWENEQRAWEAQGNPDGHIFCALQRLRNMAEG